MKKIKLTILHEDEEDLYKIVSYPYLLNKLPKLNQYFNYGSDKGYILSIIEEPILEDSYKYFTIYYEKNFGDWENSKIEIANACGICVKVK